MKSKKSMNSDIKQFRAIDDQFNSFSDVNLTQPMASPTFKQYESNTLTNKNPLEIVEDDLQEENPEDEGVVITARDEIKPKGLGRDWASVLNLNIP